MEKEITVRDIIENTGPIAYHTDIDDLTDVFNMCDRDTVQTSLDYTGFEFFYIGMMDGDIKLFLDRELFTENLYNGNINLDTVIGWGDIYIEGDVEWAEDSIPIVDKGENHV